MTIADSCQKTIALRNFVMPEDVAIASSKSEVDTCIDDQDIDRPKSVVRQTAFQL